MIEIERVTLREIRLRLKEPFRISSGATYERRILLVELEDPSRRCGWGECVAGEAPNYSPETVDTAWLAITEWLAPLVVGRAFTEPAAVFDLLRRSVRGHYMARAALEMAAWELAAQVRGVPLSQLLGGTRDRVETGISIGLQETPERAAERARDAWRAGYRRIKLKIRPGADHTYVTAARAAVGPTVPLSVDANAAYGPADVDRLQRLDELGLLMIEQPFDGEDLIRHAALQQLLTTPLCLDESITSVERASDMIDLGSGRIINIKPGRVGGLTAALAIHDLCRTRGVPVWCGGMLESGIGRAHNVALASLPQFVLPGDLSPSARYWEHDIVVPEWEMTDGTLTVPRNRPGMGVEVDRDRVERLTVRRYMRER